MPEFYVRTGEHGLCATTIRPVFAASADTSLLLVRDDEGTGTGVSSQGAELFTADEVLTCDSCARPSVLREGRLGYDGRGFTCRACLAAASVTACAHGVGRTPCEDGWDCAHCGLHLDDLPTEAVAP